MKDLFVLRRILLYGFMLVICIFALFPIGWMLLKSFHDNRVILEYPPKFFAPLTLGNYQRMIESGSFLASLKNTFVFATIGAIFSILVAVPASYVIAKIKHSWIGTLILSTRMAPYILYALPWYIILRQLGLIDTLIGVSVGYLMITLPSSCWLLIGFFREIPTEFEEAALIDGCSRYGAFFRVVLHLAIPGIAAVTIINFAECWNHLLMPLVLGGPNTIVLPVMISGFRQALDPRVGRMFAASAGSVLPILILVFWVRKYITKALSMETK